MPAPGSAMGFGPGFESGYAGNSYHVPRLSANPGKNLHLRSQSLPEAVYIQQQQQLLNARARVRVPSGHQKPVQAPGMPILVNLRRSHTNVGDLPGTGLRKPGMYLARSRSNIAALGLNPEAVYRPSSHTAHHGLPKTSIARAASFYHANRPLHNSRSLGQIGSLLALNSGPQPVSKDLSQPLHVDCSVEYDLGHQPKIPKDSAPLLIIHPGYTREKFEESPGPGTHRFHPYSVSPYSELIEQKTSTKGSSSGHGTSLASSSLSSNSSDHVTSHSRSSGNFIKKNGIQNKLVSRHSSFLVTSPPRMVALGKTLKK